MNSKRIRSSKAFTLLELIVAIALMDVIAVALYSSMYSAFKAKSKSQDAIRPFQSVTPAFEFMRHDLISAVNPDGILAGVFLGEDNSGQSRLDADTLSFYTCGYQPSEGEVASNIVNIEYALENDPDRDQTVLKRFITKNILSPTTLDPQEEIICRNVMGLNIQYYNGTAWVDEWDSSAENSQLPWGVQISLTIYDKQYHSSSNDGFRNFTRVFMLLSANQQISEAESGGAG